MRRVLGVLSVPALLVGCSAQSGRSRASWHDPSPQEESMDRLAERAAFDLNCPEEDLQIRSLGDEDTQGAAGCGRRATYLYDSEHNRWILNGVVEDRNSKATTPADNAGASHGSHGSSGGMTTP